MSLWFPLEFSSRRRGEDSHGETVLLSCSCEGGRVEEVSRTSDEGHWSGGYVRGEGCEWGEAASGVSVARVSLNARSTCAVGIAGGVLLCVKKMTPKTISTRRVLQY